LPAARAVVADGRQALLFAADDPQALAGALRRLLEDRALAAGLGRAGRELARAYTWDQRAATLLDLMAEGA
jgi:rhamnosyl/mannosyltransferase